MELHDHFICVESPYTEGTVEVFEQSIRAGQIKKAELVITALGLYEAEINGEKVGDALFTPGFTYYPKDLHFQRYDVTNLLTGHDTLTVYLAQGWYCGRYGFKNKRQIYGERPAVSWVLTVETETGKVRYCADDPGVRAVDSPYEYAGLYDGEIYRSTSSGRSVIQPGKYTGQLPPVIEEGTMCVRAREEMPVQTVTKHGNVTILDFGQNFAGIVEIDPRKMNGSTLLLRHGEILNADGSLYTANLRQAKAQILYTKNKAAKKYRPRFTYMCFRYVELSGVDYVPGLLTA